MSTNPSCIPAGAVSPCICALCINLDTEHCIMTMELLDKAQALGITGINCPAGCCKPSC